MSNPGEPEPFLGMLAEGDRRLQEFDPVERPRHYNVHPSGVECIDIVEHFNFNIGNAIKYLWRQGLKEDSIQDLQKAAWYVNREIERRQRGTGQREAGTTG